MNYITCAFCLADPKLDPSGDEPGGCHQLLSLVLFACCGAAPSLLRMLPTPASYPAWLPSPPPWRSSQCLLLPGSGHLQPPTGTTQPGDWDVHKLFLGITHGSGLISKPCRRTQPTYASGHTAASQSFSHLVCNA